MATLGELAVNVVAKTQKFNKNMKSATKDVGKFEKSVIGLSKKMGSLALSITGIGSALTAAGLVGIFNRTRNEIDKLAKSASKLGVEVQELQALQLAAERNGIAADQFATSLQRMNRRISEAAMGSGVLVDVLEAMNLNAEELNRLNPAQQFEQINAALANVPQSERIRTAFAFFDSEGVNNIRLAGQNLAQYRRELVATGKAVTTEQAKRIEKLNDSLLRLGDAFVGVANRIVVDITPALLRGLDRIETILGIRAADARPGLPTPSGGAAAMASLGLPTRIREAEFARSDVVNPLRSVFREMFAPREMAGMTQAQLDALRNINRTIGNPIEIGQ